MSTFGLIKGSVLDKLSRIEEALNCYERALKLDPTKSELWLYKGRALQKLGRDQEATICIARWSQENTGPATAEPQDEPADNIPPTQAADSVWKSVPKKETGAAPGFSKEGMTTIPAPPPPRIDNWPLPSREKSETQRIVSHDADIDQTVAKEWLSFEHPEKLFSLQLPQGWKSLQPLSEDSAFAAASPDGRVLFEVMFADTSEQRNGLEVLAALPEIMVEATRAEHPDVREVWRGDIESGSAGLWRRLIIEYIDRVNPSVYDGSTLFTTDYFFFGSEGRILFANFKSLSFEYGHLAGLFERIARGIVVPGLIDSI